MRKSLVRLPLPTLLLLSLGVLLAAALMLAGKPSAGPTHNGPQGPLVVQPAAPMQSGFARPTIRQAAPAQNGFTKPEIGQA